MRPIVAALRLPVTLLILLLPLTALGEETVCIQCHSGQQGRLGAPVSQWRGSIHERNGISCFHCHGGDPTDLAMAMSPERGFIGVPSPEEVPDFCGRCHVGVKEDYLQSAHGQALGSGGPTCVTCHGSHAVAQATPDLINSRDCSRCHDYGRAEEIKGAIAGTEALISELDGSLANLHRLGIRTDDLKGSLFAVRNDFRRLFHSVDVEKVRSQTSAFRRSLGEIRERVKVFEEEIARRKLWGGIVAGLLVVAGVLGLLLHRYYLEEDKRLP